VCRPVGHRTTPPAPDLLLLLYIQSASVRPLAWMHTGLNHWQWAHVRQCPTGSVTQCRAGGGGDVSYHEGRAIPRPMERTTAPDCGCDMDFQAHTSPAAGTLSAIETAAPRVLVTLDGSALAEAALPLAATLSRALGAEVILLQVVPPPPAPSLPSDTFDRPAQVELAKQQADAALRAHEQSFPGLRVTRVVLAGTHPAARIIDWVQEHPVAFVVMATHGHGGLRHLVTGSVTEAVVRHCLAPVIVVRPSATPAAVGR
jgi:nucleotide-binding universal stress UspA family protein